MTPRRENRFGYANIASTVALVLAVGTGSAYATAAAIGSAGIVDDSIMSVDVHGHAAAGGEPAVDGAITTDDIKNGTLRTADLGPDAVTSAKVAPNTLGGSDID